jgi:hypothetical protein
LLIPHYRGGGIVNLMASVIRARGGESDYHSLSLLPPEAMERVTNLLLMVIDGLGAGWLERQSPEGILSRHLRGTMTSVFPATTATAITTYLTGDAPQQHALTGWFTYLRELGCVMAVLPGRPRYGGVSYSQAGIDPGRLFGHRPLSERISTRAVTVSPAHIAHSDFNLAHLGRAELTPYSDLSDLCRRTARILRASREPTFLYLYWAGLDTVGHEAGIDSIQARSQLRRIEQAITDLLVSAAGTDTLLLVTGDHGQLDTGPADHIDLADHPDLADCLALPLCGEPRAAYCYVRPWRTGDFEAYCREVLGDKLELWHSRDLLERGLFGRGEPNPRLAERIGDYTLIMRERYVIRDRVPGETPYTQIGVHGGLSRAELEVPLSVLHA